MTDEHSEIIQTIYQPDKWQGLKRFTDARVALGSTGVSLPLKEALALRLAHAEAKDAVYASTDENTLVQELMNTGLGTVSVKSKAINRCEYLQRPDLGRTLQDESAELLKALPVKASDICIAIADGLSAIAINENAIPFLHSFLQDATAKNFTIAPVILATMARVALADEIGFLLKARLTIILIGERPGLSAADSMSAYLTYNPQPGTTNEKRNCISNIRSKGLPPVLAAAKAMQLITAAFQLQLTGVQLKDESHLLL